MRWLWELWWFNCDKYFCNQKRNSVFQETDHFVHFLLIENSSDKRTEFKWWIDLDCVERRSAIGICLAPFEISTFEDETTVSFVTLTKTQIIHRCLNTVLTFKHRNRAPKIAYVNISCVHLNQIFLFDESISTFVNSIKG